MEHGQPINILRSFDLSTVFRGMFYYRGAAETVPRIQLSLLVIYSRFVKLTKSE
jgi:hypothetical protein